MTLWIILTLLCCAASVLIAIRLVRRFESGRKLVTTETAVVARPEIPRRVLASGVNETPNPAAPQWRSAALVAVIGAVAVGGIGLFAGNGHRNLNGSRDEVVLPSSSMPSVAGAGDVEGRIAALAARLQKSPDDAEGWQLLGWSYFNTQRYDESAAAYARAATLKPTDNGLRSAHAEAQVQAAGGLVTPAALAEFSTVLARDPKEFRSRFYVALSREQAGDLTHALDLWQVLLADAPQDAGWRSDVMSHISDLTARTGRTPGADASLSPAPVRTAAAVPGQQAAVAGMIAKLAAKLEANPVDRDGWAMMIRSLAVTGDIDGAKEALARAQAIFATDAATRTQLEAKAASLGVVSGDGAPSEPAGAAAIKALPEQDQRLMIRGMVDGLDARLAANPHDAEGWLRLIRSRMVLNEPELAREALSKALAEFPADSDAARQFNETARSLGLTAD